LHISENPLGLGEGNRGRKNAAARGMEKQFILQMEAGGTEKSPFLKPRIQ
jgi:hypothetical protein